MSPENSKNLIRKAIEYAIENNFNIVTICHKGNIMKATEGMFRKWGYEVAKEEFKDKLVIESDFLQNHTDDERQSVIFDKGKILFNDRIQDAMFQNVLIKPRRYGVIALPNLNGDYLSDQLVAQVGGLGVAPGANLNDEIFFAEATHGTAPKWKGMNKVNPASLILSMCLLLEHIGWKEVSKLVKDSITKCVGQRKVTFDIARQFSPEIESISTTDFGDCLISNL